MDLVQLVLGIFLSGIASTTPALLYAFLLWWCDRYEREPLALVAAAFLWGAGPAAVLALVVEAMLDVPLARLGPGLAGQIASTSAAAPLVEETVKALALVALLCFRGRELDDVLDGIVYGGLVGFGFAMTENFLYFLGAFVSAGVGHWMLVVFMRGVVFGLNHAFFSAFAGAGLGLARQRGFRAGDLAFVVMGYLLAVAFHALHNLGSTLSAATPGALLISLVSDGGGLLVIFVTLALALRRERQWIARELEPEVGQALNLDEYAFLLSRARLGSRLPGPFAGRSGARRANLLTELAFRKAQARAAGHDPAQDPQVLALRRRLADQPSPQNTSTS